MIVYAYKGEDEDTHGYGRIPITVDKIIETDEEIKEVARAIGHQTGKTQISITQVQQFEYIEETD